MNTASAADSQRVAPSTDKANPGAALASPENELLLRREMLSGYLPSGSNLGYGDYRCDFACAKNVLLVGRSRVGKSSILETIINPLVAIKAKFADFSGTMSTVKKHLVVKVKDDDGDAYRYCQLNIFDTPGLGQAVWNAADVAAARSKDQKDKDKILLEMADSFVRHEVTKLHAVVLVADIRNAILLDNSTFETIEGFLGGEFAPVSSIVMTHVDQKSSKDVDSLKAQFLSNDKTKPVADYCQGRVALFAALDIETLKPRKVDTGGAEEAEMRMAKEMTACMLEGTVLPYRNELIRMLVESTSEPVVMSRIRQGVEKKEQRTMAVVTAMMGKRTDIAAGNARSQAAITAVGAQQDPEPETENIAEYLQGADFKELKIDAKYTVHIASSLNILLVGRSQVGKSTIVNTFQCPQSVLKTSGLSVTKDPQMYNLVVTHHHKDATGLYHLNIIDTPGLGEVTSDGKSRDDEAIMGLINTFVNKEITTLHAVLFVSIAGQTQTVDLKFIELLRDYLGNEISSVSAIVLTHADRLADDTLNKYKENISKAPNSEKMAKFCGLGIMTIGCADVGRTDGVTASLVTYKLEQKLMKVEKQRSELLELILRDREGVEVTQLVRMCAAARAGNDEQMPVPESLPK